jgi:hypothetical protein
VGKIYRSALTKNELIDTATVDVIAGQFVKLGERKIEAGELLTVGFGQQSGQNTAQGRMYMDIRDNAAAPGVVVNGTIRLSVYSPQNRPLVILSELRTETASGGTQDDRASHVPLPEDMTWLSEDKKLVLEFAADATGTVGKTNSAIIMDTTTEEM